MKKNNTIEDDLRLFEETKNGDITAKNILTEKHLALVKKIVFNKKSLFLHLTANPLCDIDDILQEGYMGLLDALNKADSKKSPLCELEEKEFKEKISFVLSSNILSKREIICVELAFGLNGNEQHKFKNIAIRFRISEARISQIISEALEKLRHNEQIIKIFKEYFNCNNGSS